MSPIEVQDSQPLNAHVPAPLALRQLFREFKALSPKEIDAHPRIIDLERSVQSPGILKCPPLRREDIIPTFEKFLRSGTGDDESGVIDIGQKTTMSAGQDDFPVYTLQGVTGQHD